MLSLVTNTASPELICLIVVNSGHYASQWGLPACTPRGQVEAGNMGRQVIGHVTIRPARKARFFQLNRFDSFQARCSLVVMTIRSMSPVLRQTSQRWIPVTPIHSVTITQHPSWMRYYHCGDTDVLPRAAQSIICCRAPLANTEPQSLQDRKI
jgi:hypothetical protein